MQIKVFGDLGHDSVEDAKTCLYLIKEKLQRGKSFGTPQCMQERYTAPCLLMRARLLVWFVCLGLLCCLPVVSVSAPRKAHSHARTPSLSAIKAFSLSVGSISSSVLRSATRRR